MEGAATVHRLLPKPPLAPGLLGVRAPASPGVRVAGLQASGSLGLSPTSAPGTDTPARAELIWRAAMMPGARAHTHTPPTPGTEVGTPGTAYGAALPGHSRPDGSVPRAPGS